jgi:hypothetical protein
MLKSNACAQFVTHIPFHCASFTLRQHLSPCSIFPPAASFPLRQHLSPCSIFPSPAASFPTAILHQILCLYASRVSEPHYASRVSEPNTALTLWSLYASRVSEPLAVFQSYRNGLLHAANVHVYMHTFVLDLNIMPPPE